MYYISLILTFHIFKSAPRSSQIPNFQTYTRNLSKILPFLRFKFIFLYKISTNFNYNIKFKDIFLHSAFVILVTDFDSMFHEILLKILHMYLFKIKYFKKIFFFFCCEKCLSIDNFYKFAHLENHWECQKNMSKHLNLYQM